MSTDLGEYGDPEREQPVAYTRRRSFRGRSRPVQLAALLVVLVVVEGVALGARLRVDHAAAADPATVARAMFAALSQDDAASARALLTGPTAGVELFGPAVLHAETAVQFARVTAVTRSGDTATVTVTYEVGELPARSVLRERRTLVGPLHAPRWRIVGGLPLLHVTAPAFEPVVRVAGQEVPLRNGVADVTVFPGIVNVALPTHLPAGDTAQTVPATGDGLVVAISVDLDSAVRQEVADKVGDRLLPMVLAHGGTVSVTDIELGPDGRSLTFDGEVLTSTGASNDVVGQRDTVTRLSGTAVYESGTITITGLLMTTSS